MNLANQGIKNSDTVMTIKVEKINAVPTNIITGFLGVGKTSAILHLLKQKPHEQRWAVLVNEFGEIGVDGSLYAGHTAGQEIFIREVPGGCMCCTAGLPMQIALNELLVRSNPDRLLIEPTGLGHPQEVLKTLSADHYREVLSLQKILTLVDARKLSDSRYTTHETFKQQISIADTVVGNKTDLYEEAEKPMLEAYVSQEGAAHARVIFSQDGQIPISELDGSTLAKSSMHHQHEVEQKPILSELPIPECGYIRANNEGEGYQSIGWRFSPSLVFKYEKLFALLSGIVAERMKAVFITEKGVYSYNLTPDALVEFELDDCMESRMEVIVSTIDNDWEKQLMDCII